MNYHQVLPDDRSVAIVSAFTDQTADTNEARHIAFGQVLHSDNHFHQIEVLGAYDGDEKSYAFWFSDEFKGSSIDTMAYNYGMILNQHSILLIYPRGHKKLAELHWIKEDRIHQFTGVIQGNDCNDLDYYSDVAGEKFAFTPEPIW